MSNQDEISSKAVDGGLGESAPVGVEAGLEAAARFVDQRREAYDDECGSTDPETGTREYPGTGDEYVGELLEIAEGIRALAQQPAAVDEAMVERAARALWEAQPSGHKMMAKAGYPTDWPSQPAAIKRNYARQARAALTAALAVQQGGRDDG